MLWSDISDVTVRTFSRREPWIPLTTGSRHHIVVSGHHRLGSGQLLIPYKLLGLDNAGVKDLVRRILVQKEIARTGVRPSAPATTGFGQRKAASEPAEAPSSFDPDAIIRRYMAEREQLLRDDALARERAMIERPVGGFGRKRVG
jgi:hypothetical protein